MAISVVLAPEVAAKIKALRAIGYNRDSIAIELGISRDWTSDPATQTVCACGAVTAKGRQRCPGCLDAAKRKRAEEANQRQPRRGPKLSPVTVAALAAGHSPDAIRNRIRNGMTLEEAIAKPPTVRAARGKGKPQHRGYTGRDRVQVRARLRASQHGRCAACNTADCGPLGLVIDHCHRTGVVRALLCSNCNTALGLLRESPERIRALLKYAESWNQLRLVGAT